MHCGMLTMRNIYGLLEESQSQSGAAFLLDILKYTVYFDDRHELSISYINRARSFQFFLCLPMHVPIDKTISPS